jgi:flagellar biosynthesis protein FlhF
MRIKKYEGPTMRETMAKVRSELGPDAVILKTRKIKPSGLLSFLSKDLFEVTAAMDANFSEYHPKHSQNAPVNSTASSDLEEQFSALKSEIAEIKSLVWAIARRAEESHDQNSPDTVDNLSRIYALLLAQEVENDIAKDLLISTRSRLLQEETLDIGKVRRVLGDCISTLVNVSGPLAAKEGEKKIVTLIGPTGAGKTTTIAKLAAQFSLFERKRIGMITTDTYRIAAVDQLKTYTNIIGVPLEVVYSENDVKSAFNKHRDKDLILVDTVGRSPRNAGDLLELTKSIGEQGQAEVHLVLSANTKFADQMEAVNLFGPAKPDRLIFTKLDETSTFGNLLSVAASTDSDISYLTTGQNVPDDIEVAESKRIADLIVG